MPRTKTLPTDALRILIVDRDRTAAEALAAGIGSLLPLRPEVVAVDSGRMGADALRAGYFDIAALDVVSLADLGGSAEDCIARLVKLAADALTVAVSEGQSVSEALTAMRAGAHDVVAKPLDAATFASRVGALAQRYGRAWAIHSPACDADTDMSAMLSGASAALRAAESSPRRPPVLPMWQQEQRIIEDAIASFSGNITLAAQALELNPSTIYRKRQAWAEMESGTKGAA